MTCPLPIDWLDLLEGRDSPAERTHLLDCLSCRALVDALEEQVVEPLGPLVIDERLLEAIKSAPRWRETRPRRARPGEIWLTSSSLQGCYEGLDRQLVLVLYEQWAFGRKWLGYAPVDTAVEEATSIDMRLEAEESSLGVPLVVFFRHQSLLHRVQLESRLGALSEDGERLVEDALAGVYVEERWGLPLEGPDDPRLRRADDVRVKRALDSYYWSLADD